MKVIAISASPRKGGNSDVLCDRFLLGASESGNETEKFFLRDLKISPCLGCKACGKSGTCIQKDDMTELLEKVIDADVLVLATPVYFYCMDAQMKMFIDRCLPRYREITNKKVYYIITAADPEHSAADGTIMGLRGFLSCLSDSSECGIVYGTGTWDKGDVYRHPSLDSAYQMGKEI